MGFSALERLAAALFVGSEHPESRLMGLFTAYLDASGNAVNQPFIVVSGYIANFVQWDLLDTTWKDVHLEFGVNLPFHMAEFVAACTNDKYKLQHNARADYVNIATDPIRSEIFLRNLCNCQVSFMNCAVTSVIRMEIYNQIDSLIELREAIPPYALGARHCVERIHKWEKDYEIEEPVEMIFEEGDFEQGKFSELMVGEGKDLPIYKKKKDFSGLQAADHYAWEAAFRLKQLQNNPQPLSRIQLAYLLHSVPKLHIEPTQESLINLCHERGIKARSWRK